MSGTSKTPAGDRRQFDFEIVSVIPSSDGSMAKLEKFDLPDPRSLAYAMSMVGVGNGLSLIKPNAKHLLVRPVAGGLKSDDVKAAALQAAIHAVSYWAGDAGGLNTIAGAWHELSPAARAVVVETVQSLKGVGGDQTQGQAILEGLLADIRAERRRREGGSQASHE